METVQEPFAGAGTPQAVLHAAIVWEQARSAYYSALRDVAGVLSMADIRALAEARDIAEHELRLAILTWIGSAPTPTYAE